MTYFGLPALINDFIIEKATAKKEEGSEKYFPVNWLQNAAKRASQIKFITHGLKYTHVDAKGSSILCNTRDRSISSSEHHHLIHSKLISNFVGDFAGNAAVLDVGKLLLLSYEGKRLIDYVIDNDSSPLKPFADSESQLNDWMLGFSKVLDSDDVSSHKLSKQIYFPTNKNDYHLLSPLFSSVLCHELDAKLRYSRYSEEMKDTRKDRKEGKYSEKVLVAYPDLAIQAFGGTKPQNISQLNSERGGKTFLLSCRPPDWNSSKKPPLGIKSVFSKNQFGRIVSKQIWFLKEFLKKQVGKTNTSKVRDARAKSVDNIIDSLIQYGCEIQNMSESAGWSSQPECLLTMEEKLWLDPLRARFDSNFAHEREMKEWCEKISIKFAQWFNKRLEDKMLTMGDTEFVEWKSLLEKKLLKLKDDLEVYS